MESTGVLWRPISTVLEDQFELILANAHEIKALPGRKTDVRDCEWIADLLRHGLIRPSFIPAKPVRVLRDLMRYRKSLVYQHTQQINRLHKVLETANIKLTSVVSDVWGKSGQSMIKAIREARERCADAHAVSAGNLAQQTTAVACSLGRADPTSSPRIAAADLRPAALLGVLDASLSSRRSKHKWSPIKW